VGKGSPYSMGKKYKAGDAAKRPISQVKPRFPSIDVSPAGEVHISAAEILREDDDALNKARKTLEKGNIELAGRLLGTLSKKYPLDFDVLDTHVDYLQQKSGDLVAAGYLSKTIDNVLGIVRERTAPGFRGKEATLLVPPWFGTNREFLEAIERRGYMEYMAGEYGLALESYMTILKFDPSDDLGVQEFILHFSVLAKQPDNVNRMDELLLAGKAKNSQEHVDDSAPVLLGRGLCLHATGKLTDAKAFFTSAVQKNPFLARNLVEDMGEEHYHLPAIEQAQLDAGHISNGWESEAVVYIRIWNSLWKGVPDARRLLVEVAHALDYHKLIAERNIARKEWEVRCADVSKRKDILLRKIGKFEGDPRVVRIGELLDGLFQGTDKETVAKMADESSDAWNLIKRVAADVEKAGVDVAEALSELEIPVDQAGFDILMILNQAGKVGCTGMYERAISIGNELTAMFPTTPTETRRWIADAHFGQGDIATGDATYEAIVAADPENLWGHIAWGDQYSAIWSPAHVDYPKAEKHYLDAVKAFEASEDETDGDTLLDRLLELYAKTGDAGKAGTIKARFAAMGIEPSNEDDYLARRILHPT
jgi:tetratricopeptide (TPR) repeat protein